MQRKITYGDVTSIQPLRMRLNGESADRDLPFHANLSLEVRDRMTVMMVAPGQYAVTGAVTDIAVEDLPVPYLREVGIDVPDVDTFSDVFAQVHQVRAFKVRVRSSATDERVEAFRNHDLYVGGASAVIVMGVATLGSRRLYFPMVDGQFTGFIYRRLPNASGAAGRIGQAGFILVSPRISATGTTGTYIFDAGAFRE